MPVFTIKAKDRLAIAVIHAYQALCEDRGLPQQAAEVGKALTEMVQWQARNPEQMQMPDHPHVPVGSDG